MCALQLSGLPINNFAFYGFVPKQESKIKQFFTKIKNDNLTGVFFVSASHLNKSIHKISEYIGEKDVCVCKEITKLNEEVFRGRPSKILMLIERQKILLKGEFTIVVGGTTKTSSKEINDDVSKEMIKLLKKFNLTEVVKIVHSLTGISRKEIYQMTIKLKDD